MRRHELCAESNQFGFDVPGKIAGRQHEDLVGPIERVAQAVPMNPHAHGIGARFEYCDDSALGLGIAQRGKGRPNGRGMVREIVVESDPIVVTALFQPPSYSLKSGERLQGRCHRDTSVRRATDRSKGVLDVVPAQERPTHPPRAFALAVKIKARTRSGRIEVT